MLASAQDINAARRTPTRVMPHDIDMEASILGGVLLRNEVLDDLRDLEVDDFYDMKHRVVWTAMRNLEASQLPIDVVTLRSEIEKQGKLEALGGVGFIGELQLRVPTVDNVASYRDTVRLHARNRRAILLLSTQLERAYTWPHDPAELISETAGELQRIEQTSTKEPTFRLMTIDDALDDLSMLQNAPVFATPFDTLNELIGFGGLVGTQVYTVAAGTGRGKTTFVAELGSHVAEHVGVPVLVSVHELGPGYFVARKAAGALGVRSNEIVRGSVDRKSIHRVMPYPNMFFLKRPTLRGLRDAADHVAQKFGRAPLLIVDYLQKLADEIASRQARPDLRMATSEASAAMLEIGERTGAAIIAVSSIGRGKQALKNPRKHHPYELVEVAKESGAVEYDGAGMIVLSLSDEMDGDERVGTITLAKARFGVEKHIDARYHGARGTWRDIGAVEVVEKAPKSDAKAKEPAKENVTLAEIKKRLIQSLNEAPARGKDHLVNRITGARKTDIRRAFEELWDEGVIAKVGTGITLSQDGRQRLMVGL